MQPFVIVRALHGPASAALGEVSMILVLHCAGHRIALCAANNAKMQLEVFLNCKTFLNIIVYCDEQSQWDLHRNRMDVKCMSHDNEH